MIRACAAVLFIFTLLCGLAYPLAVTGIAQLAFPRQANGSLVEADGKPVGSALIGQAFSDAKYVWGRPSATTPPYNAGASAGSSLAPGSAEQRKQVAARVAALKAADPQNTQRIPLDLVTASASGLDPDISPAAADYQADRVARARGVSPESVRTLIASHTQGRLLGVWGQRRVNVLAVNLALDQGESR